MSKTTDSIIAAAAEAGVSVDEYMAGMADIRRQEVEWAAIEARLSDRDLDRLDAPDGPLNGFNCWKGGE